MLVWKRLLVLEEFENERLPEIVLVAFGKMRSKSTLDLSTWRLPNVTAKKWRKLSICQDVRACGVNRGLPSFCYLRKVRNPVHNHV